MLTDYVNMEQMKNANDAIFNRLNLCLSEKGVLGKHSYLKYALAFNKFRCQTLEMEMKKSPVESGMKYQFHESKIFCQNFVVNDLMLSLNVSNEKTSSC